MKKGQKQPSSYSCTELSKTVFPREYRQPTLAQPEKQGGLGKKRRNKIKWKMFK